MCLYLKYWLGRICTDSGAMPPFILATFISYSSGGWFSGSLREPTPAPMMAAATTPRRISSMRFFQVRQRSFRPHVQLARHRGGAIEHERAQAADDRSGRVRLHADGVHAEVLRAHEAGHADGEIGGAVGLDGRVDGDGEKLQAAAEVLDDGVGGDAAHVEARRDAAVAAVARDRAGVELQVDGDADALAGDGTQ